MSQVFKGEIGVQVYKTYVLCDAFVLLYSFLGYISGPWARTQQKFAGASLVNLNPSWFQEITVPATKSRPVSDPTIC